MDNRFFNSYARSYVPEYIIKSMKIIIIFYISLLVSWSCFSVELSQPETKIVEEIRRQLPRALTDLEIVVNINSGTLNVEGVQQVGQIFKGYFDELGFTTQWIEQSSVGRAGHLVASYGHQGPKILLIGHIDTVFSKDDAFQQFEPIDARYVKGPGITDMKGGDMIIVAVMRALKATGALDRMQIKVVMTGDEERSGQPLSESKRALIEAGKWADIALGFEDGDSNIKTAVISRRGAIGWHLQVTGKPAHSSQIFTSENGDGAIFETARILEQMRQALQQFENLTFNPGLIAGGTTVDVNDSSAQATAFGKTNVIAKTVEVKGDLRTLSVEQLNQAKQLMQQIVADNLPKTSATLSFEEGYPPMAPTAANKTLLGQYSEISQALGYGSVVAVNPRNAGAADISFVANDVEMAMDGLGLMGRGGHTHDEIADMDSYVKNMNKAAILLYRLSTD